MGLPTLSGSPEVGTQWRTPDGRLLTLASYDPMRVMIFTPDDDRPQGFRVPEEEWDQVEWTEVV